MILNQYIIIIHLQKINFLSKNYTNQNDKYIKFLIDENTSITDLDDLDNNKTITQTINKSSYNDNFMYTSINNALRINTIPMIKIIFELPLMKENKTDKNTKINETKNNSKIKENLIISIPK